MYGDILIGQDICKILKVDNVQRLLLIDKEGQVEKYKQVIVARYQEKLLCVLRKKDDFTFGQTYIIENNEGIQRLVKETDSKAVGYLKDLYYQYLQKSQSQ